MRIGMITGEYPPLEGGVGDFTRELGMALHTDGHEIHIFTSQMNDRQPSPVQEDELAIYRDIYDWDRSTHTEITRWINTLALDVVNIQYQAAAYQMRGGINFYPRAQKRRLTAPIVVTYHDLLPPYLFPKAGPLRQWSVRQLAQHADGVIVTNGDDYTALAATMEVKLPPTRLIPIGSNIAPQPPPGYDRMAWRAARGIYPNDMLIGFFGFLNRGKGVETLIDALGHLVTAGLPAHLIFIGGRTGSSDSTNARYADEIDAVIEKAGLGAHVQRTGYTTPAEVSAALLAVDVCALPYRNGASLRHGTLHAALAHGNAIVTTTPQTETPQLQDGKNILLIPPDNATALVNALDRLWREPRLRAEISAQATQLSREFSWERIAARTAEFFRTVRGQVNRK
ncbi:MAG: glycosyltransferase family 4 protein [Anaerolineae bacterium]|nr:glycosyltransferase family 4 protein [Anaerolineae bacterium]